MKDKTIKPPIPIPIPAPPAPDPTPNLPITSAQIPPPPNKKRKIIIITLAAALILALSAATFFLIYHPAKAPSKPETPESTEDNNSANPPSNQNPEGNNNSASSNTPTTTPNQTTESQADIDKTALELFTQASNIIRELSVSSPCDYKSSSTSEGITVVRPIEEKLINGISYAKTTLKFQDALNKYFNIFTGAALNYVLSGNFTDIDGTLYCTWHGSSGYGITDIKVALISSKNSKYTYKATYKNVFYTLEDIGAPKEEYSQPLTNQFTIEKINNKWQISQIDFPK